MNRKKLTPAIIKAIELDILLAFANFCDEHQLNYYLANGTLLGAVRHGGFIPWDDDIDVIMKREDYEKLNVLLEKETIRDDLTWATHRNRKYDGPFGKVYNINTDANYCGNGIGLWIDVFPVDYYDRRKLNLTFFLRKVCIAKRTMHFSLNKKSISKLFLKYLFFPFSRYTISNWIDRIAISVKENTMMVQSVWTAYYHECWPAELLNTPSFVTFEGYKFKTVSNPDTYLSQLYGDYMKLPPEEKRRSHGLEALWLGNNECPFK